MMTVGDVALILGDKWAAENSIVRGETDPTKSASPEWVELARAKLDEREKAAERLSMPNAPKV